MRIAAAISRATDAPPRIEPAELSGPRAGEVLVRIAAAGICHTDLRVHGGGGVGTPRPVVLGHEGAGVVEAVGPGGAPVVARAAGARWGGGSGSARPRGPRA